MYHPFTPKMLFQFLATVSPKAVTLDDDNFSMVGQAALHGPLKKVRGLGMPLRSVSRIAPGQAKGLSNETHRQEKGNAE
ncbi:MAG: hypothetical protein H6642_17170 [Caldilineaceae bacterium]|nr:hypothetical protein [Caldilineaceae bacterium]